MHEASLKEAGELRSDCLPDVKKTGQHEKTTFRRERATAKLNENKNKKIETFAAVVDFDLGKGGR